MKNQEVSDLLDEIADYLELQEEKFKVRAYRRASLVILSYADDVEDVWKHGKLTSIPGVGEGIAKKIDDFLEHGKSTYLEKLKKETPIDMEHLGKIEGLGPKTVVKLFKKLKVKTVKDLEKAAKTGKIQGIEGLGPTVEKNILKSIAFSRTSSDRHLMGYALPVAQEIVNSLKKLSDVNKIEIAGSTRRRKEAIRDIDILITSKKPANVMDFFVKMDNVKQVLAHGPSKSSVRLKDGFQVDVRVMDEKNYGAALLYFTGSKQHNIILRKIAIEKNLKLSEYGVFNKKTNKLLAAKTENEVYHKLGLPFIEPELREDNGEIEAAKKHKLPKLIGYNDIKGDLQMHSTWSDGNDSIQEMALAAKKLGHEYICLTDHTGNLKIANALDEKRINQQGEEIKKLNKKFHGFEILQGVEVNIKENGLLDVKDEILKKLDVVVASIHSGFKNTKEKLTNRMLKAMENENVDIIAHPTGRLINRRPAYELDFEKIFDMTKKTDTVMEINAFPDRLDLKDVHVRQAISQGVKIVINTDAHSVDHLPFMEFGIATARRGWAEKKDIVNSLPWKSMLKSLK